VQPSTAPRGPVTILARLGGLLLALIGLLWGVIGGGFVVGGAFLKNLFDVNTVPGFGDFFGGALATIGIVLLVFAIIEILAGIGGMLGKGWARAIGILYALVFGAFSLLIVVDGGRARDAGDVGNGALLFFVVHAVIYAYVLIVFLVRWRGRPA
jgi:hypothetical protein